MAWTKQAMFANTQPGVDTFQLTAPQAPDGCGPYDISDITDITITMTFPKAGEGPLVLITAEVVVNLSSMRSNGDLTWNFSSGAATSGDSFSNHPAIGANTINLGGPDAADRTFEVSFLADQGYNCAVAQPECATDNWSGVAQLTIMASGRHYYEVVPEPSTSVLVVGVLFALARPRRRS